MGRAAMGAIHAFRFRGFTLVGIGLFILIGLVAGAIRHIHALIYGLLHCHRIAGIRPKSMRSG